VVKRKIEKHTGKRREERRKVMTNAEQSSWEEWQRRSSKPKQKVDLFRIAKQMKRDRQDVIGGKYIKNKNWEIKVNEK